ncbi:hypothetical protein LH464_21270 [Neorhizobium sp. T786]|uniref:hypothetical protein n=1 Tax=Pseudorhizobium xiangyangii TaxID=2883104 RepID=UPI001CFFB52C|nr:hypothetical protein [Neorhizobium xiangyangii]MCB5205000.1 hypothetical protein [Neorhizobium xiangyangii]
MADDIEDLRKLLFNMMARVAANEQISRAAFAILCSYDNDPELSDKLKSGIFPHLIENEKKRDWGLHPSVDHWLRTRTVDALNVELEQTLELIERIRKTSKRNVN